MAGKGKWKIVLSLILAIFFLSTLAQAAVLNSTGENLIYLPFVRQPAEHWIHHYGDNSEWISEAATGIIPTQDGNLILLVEQGQSPTKDPEDDFLLVKISPIGIILWQKGIGTAENPDFHLNGQETNDGGLILSGLSYHPGTNTNGAQVIKTTATGDIQWQRNFGGKNFDYALSIQQTADGGYIFTGFTGSYGVSKYDMWLVKLAANGSTEWQKTIALVSGFQWGSALRQTEDGGYVVAGQAGYGINIYDLWVVKLTANGSVSWQKRYGGSNHEYGRDIVQTNDGGYLVVGRTESFAVEESDGWIIRINSTGDIIWQKRYDRTAEDEFNDMYPTNDGRFLIVGTTGRFDPDTWLLLVDGSGNIIWEKTYGGEDRETGDFVQQLANGKIMVAGYTTSYGRGFGDAWVLKLDSNGNVANCDLIKTSAAIVMNTAVTPQSTSLILRDSQANAHNSTLPSINTNIQMTPICEG